MSELVSGYPRVSAVIQDGIQRGLHTGLQLYVSIDGQPMIDGGYGMATKSLPMTPLTIMPWRSAGKPLTVVLLLRLLVQRGYPGADSLSEVLLDSHVRDWLPEFGMSELGETTLRQILTHTGGFPLADTGWPHENWDETQRRLLGAVRELPAGTAAYHPQSSWFLLGEICRRLMDPSVTFSELIRQELLQPLGMVDAAASRTSAEISRNRDLFPVIYERQGASLEESPYTGNEWVMRESPGASLRGPVRELGKFYEMLLRHGQTADGRELLSSRVLEKCFSRQRAGEFDRTFQHIVDFGLGWIVNSNRYGMQTIPYGFGRYSSDESFGHGGSQCSIGFCDPVRKLVVVWSANGFCGEGQHQRRNRALNEAIYLDLYPELAETRTE